MTAQCEVKRGLGTGSLFSFGYPRYILLPSVIYSCAFVFGTLAYYLLKFPFTDTINAFVAAHFSDAFADCKSFSEYANAVIAASTGDIKHLFYIFVAGFTMFSKPAIYAINFYRGASLSFAAGYFVNSIKLGVTDFKHSTVLLFVFLVSNAIIASLVIMSSAKAFSYIEEFRCFNGKLTKIVTSRGFYMHIYCFTVAAGGILITNLIRLLINSFLY